MTEPLRESTDTSRYERPTQGWSCGADGAGRPCPLGPDARGRCRGATAECRPQRRGEGWACSRPAAAGGPCPEGPAADGACAHPLPPCHPVRSLRALRGRVTGGVAVLSLGVVLWFLGAAQEVASPGDLTFAHGTVTQTCDACHTAVAGRPAAWFQTAVSPHVGIADSRLCLECHKMGDNALAAHGLPASTLADARRRAAERLVPSRAPLLLAAARAWPGTPAPVDGEWACAVCHREHHGKEAKLGQLGDRQCQACHAAPFHGFGADHPEFAGYPYHTRTHLRYDHVSHLGRHYDEKEFRRIMPQGKAPTSCLDCHEQGTGGRLMLVRGFDRACASCHLGQIEDSSLGGIAFLNLPGVDVATLNGGSAPRAVGQWPASASGDLSPFLRLLLWTDDRFVRAEAALDGKVNLRDLRGANAEQLRAAEVYVWAVKDCFYDLAHEGSPALRRRLERELGGPLDGPELSALTGDLPRELVRDAGQLWLPDLDAELTAHRAGKPVPSAVAPPPAAATPPAGAEGRWYRHDADFSIRFRPKGHAGDFLRTWLTRTANPPPSRNAAPLRAIFADLSDPYAPGRCMKCHGVEAVGDGYRIHWTARREVPDEHAFTKFAHVPHFSLLGVKGCKTCHVLNEAADFDRGFVRADHTLNTDPATFQSSFRPMAKAACTKCHVEKAAGDSCLTCHNYHVGRLPPGMPKATFP